MWCDIILLKVKLVKISMSHVCFKVSFLSSDVSSVPTWRSHKSQAHVTTNDIIHNSLDFCVATLGINSCVTT